MAAAEAIVRLVAGEPEVRVEVLWRDATLNLLRGREEPVERFLVRLGISCGKHSGLAAGGDRKRAKKEKKKAAAQVGPLPAEGQPQVTATGIQVGLVDADGVQVPGDTKVVDALKQGARLEIEGESLPIRVNPPTITKLEVFGRPVAGSPLVASLECEFCEPKDFTIYWTRQATAGSGGGNDAATDAREGEGRIFIVPADAVGHTIIVKAEAKAGSACSSLQTRASYRVGLVEAGPGGWVERRLSSFCPRDDGFAGVRVLCYNMLAAPYAQSQTAAQDMFPYCPAHALDFSYRQPMLGRELHRLDADLMFLQECHYPTFQKFLVPVYSSGFYTRVTLKASRVSEGCALLIRKSMFQVVEERDFRFREVLRTEPAFREVLRELRAKWPDFVTGILPHMTTIFQLSVVRHIPSGRVIVMGNTHLFFHPRARHIRLLQVMCMLQLLQDLRERFRDGGSGAGGDSGSDAQMASSSSPLPPVILAGDFNCTPDTGVMELLLTGQVSSEHPDWAHCKQFAWGRDGEMNEDGSSAAGGTEAVEDVGDEGQDGLSESSHGDGEGAAEQPLPADRWQPGLGVRLTNPLGKLRSAYEGAPLPFTNFVQDFKATLDYILCTEGWDAVKTLSGPSEAEVSEHGGLPSVLHPSDHLSLAADLVLPPVTP